MHAFTVEAESYYSFTLHMHLKEQGWCLFFCCCCWVLGSFSWVFLLFSKKKKTKSKPNVLVDLPVYLLTSLPAVALSYPTGSYKRCEYLKIATSQVCCFINKMLISLNTWPLQFLLKVTQRRVKVVLPCS